MLEMMIVRSARYCLCLSSVLLTCATIACSFFPESLFDLSPKSRLPKWFSVPTGLSRPEVGVKMAYYIDSSGRTARFTLYVARTRRTLETVTGRCRGDQPTVLQSQPDSDDPEHPSYEVITAKGITDVVEHRRREPVFY